MNPLDFVKPENLSTVFEAQGYGVPVPEYGSSALTKVRELAKASNQNPANKLKKIARRLKLQKPDPLVSQDSHVINPALFELATDACILDNVVRLLGPNLLLWTAQVLYTQPGEAGAPWHSDPDCARARGVILFLALTDKTLDRACPQIIPGTHRQAMSLDNMAAKEGTNLADTPQVVALANRYFPQSDAHAVVSVDLSPGQYLLMTGGVWRGVTPNLSSDHGMAFIARYTTPEFAGQVANPCILVHGEDRFHQKSLHQPP
ncbi:MAG: phytanoyl-CoA dioxygenase family protein [Nodosilinea sp.]